MNFIRPSKFRTLLVLGRVSNLPTVWSNCLAGWLLAGGGRLRELVFVAFSVTCLYLGGMFLNDAFDAEFDRKHRALRPIPSGEISEKEVWRWGAGWLSLGLAALVWMNPATAILAVLLVFFIVLYDAVHKALPVAPILMGLCRLFIYLVAASVTAKGVTGEAIWKGIALGAYVVGLSCLARKESTRVRIRYWPCLLLGAPILFAWGFEWAPWPVTVVCVWVIWSLRYIMGRSQPNVGATVSRLLAGIALVDLLAVASPGHVGWFVLWFILSLGLQRFIPAT